MPEAQRPELPSSLHVPPELLELKRWCGWRAVWDESKKKFKKPPYSPVTGEAIGPVIKWAEHWLTFDQALAGVRQQGLDGLGFVFLEADGYLGVDFDDCRQDGVIHPAVQSWLQWLPSYQEISPSQTGVHVIGKGHISRALTATPVPNGNGSCVELYNKDRYFTFTGIHLDGILHVADVQTGVDKLLATLAKPPADPEPARSMSRLTARKIHQDNLIALRQARMGEGNATLNSCAFFAGRAFASGALDGTEDKIKDDLLHVVLNWAHPHPEEGARETIRSGWSSGVAQPLVIKDDDFPAVLQTIEDLNEKYFLVKSMGTKARVCSEERNRLTPGEAYYLNAQSVFDFKVGLMNQIVMTGMKENGTPKFEDKASIWLKHPNRREYDRVIFEPNHEAPPRVYNLWKGFAYQPIKGDCGLYLAHLKNNVCQDDETKYRYLISWMAHACRHPDQQGHVAIVIQGLKGVGKNFAAEPFATLFGQHGLVVSDQGRITRNFNSHLRDKCTLICDEAFFAGDRRHEGVLKALITGNTITIEAKGVDVEMAPNLLHIIILGNDAWLVPASWEERRFLMLNCGAKQQKNQRYFGAVLHQLQHGGYEALLYHLLHEVDLRSFNVREAPHTAELREQMSESLRGVEAAWYECLYSGMIPAHVLKNGSAEMRTDTFIEWARAKERGWANLKQQHAQVMLGVNPRGEKMGFNFNKVQPLLKESRQRYWDIPPLDRARKIWDELRWAASWPDDGNSWEQLTDQEAKF